MAGNGSFIRTRNGNYYVSPFSVLKMIHCFKIEKKNILSSLIKKKQANQQHNHSKTLIDANRLFRK